MKESGIRIYYILYYISWIHAPQAESVSLKIIAREPQINKYTTKIIVKEKENNT